MSKYELCDQLDQFWACRSISASHKPSSSS